MNVAVQERTQLNPKHLLRVMALMAVAVLVTLFTFGQAHAVDMLAGQSGTVNDTFGANSTVAKWIILAEVIIGVASYIKTKTCCCCLVSLSWLYSPLLASSWPHNIG